MTDPATAAARLVRGLSAEQVLRLIVDSPCYRDLDTPNERLLEEEEPCPRDLALAYFAEVEDPARVA